MGAKLIAVGAHSLVAYQPQIETARLRVDVVPASSLPPMQQPWVPHELACQPPPQQQQQRRQQQQPPQKETQVVGSPQRKGGAPPLAQAIDVRQKARDLQCEFRPRVEGVPARSLLQTQQPWVPHDLHCQPPPQQQQQWHHRSLQGQQQGQQQPPRKETQVVGPRQSKDAALHLEQAADARQKARNLQFELRLEMKHMERAIKKTFNEEARLQHRLRTEVQRGNGQMFQLLARNVVQTRRAAARLQKTKASMQVVDLQVTQSIASLSARSCVRLSADALRQLGETVQLSELEQAVQDLCREAAHCSHVENACNESFNCSGEVEEVADAEVRRLLEELALDRHLQRQTVHGNANQAVSATSTVPLAAAAFVPQTPARPTHLPGRAALPARWPARA